MALHTVPMRTDGSAFWQQRTPFEGVDYLLDFAWNGRELAWYLTVSDANEIAIVRGIKLIANRPLFRRYRSRPGFPQGELMIVDPSEQIEIPGFDDLVSVDLIYADVAELAG